MTREEIEAEIIARAQSDESFMAALRSDPKGVLEKELQKLHKDLKLPATTKVTLAEETPDHIYLHIPLPKEKDFSDAELAAMAGGAGGTVVVTTTTTVDTTAVVSNPAVMVVDAISFTMTTIV